MLFKEIRIATTKAAEELVADVFWNYSTHGVCIYDTSDLYELYKSDLIWDYVDEALLKQSDVVTVVGYAAPEALERTLSSINADINAIKERSAEIPFGSLEVVVGEVDDQEWLENWKKFYSPIDVGKLVVVPMWLTYENPQGKQLVKMNPGTAFGSGEHETTKLCLQLLSETQLQGKRVLDVGTGSGILAIAAKKLGAGQVTAFDIDEIAVTSAKSNAALNDISSEIEIFCGDLLTASDRVADVILANITADILIRLSRDINAHLSPSGTVILSGIIEGRLPEVKAAYLAQGFTLQKCERQGEWYALLLSKNA